MTLEIILGILIIVGTIAGTGLGYALSMRGKREEWAKEYREKRILPLIDHVNRHMHLCIELRRANETMRTLEKQCDESKSKVSEFETKFTESKSKEHLDELIEAKEQLLQRLEESKKAIEKFLDYLNQLRQLVPSDALVTIGAMTVMDEQLGNLMIDWVESSTDFATEFSDTRLGQMLKLGGRILSRADEVIIKGSKKPKGEK